MNRYFARLQACIHMLEACPAFRSSPHPLLDFGFHWMRSLCVWEESFHSRSAAARDAEQAFQPLYHPAEEALRLCRDTSSPDGLYSELCPAIWGNTGNVNSRASPTHCTCAESH